MTRRHPQSTPELQRRILRMADSAVGLTWRRLHDAVATDDRQRARDALFGLAQTKALHTRQHGRRNYYFATAEQAAAWVPPQDFIPPRPTVARNPAPEATTPEAVRYTRIDGYTHDPRYQIGPRQQPPALWSALPAGKYLED